MTREEAIAMLKSKLDGHTDTSYEWCECVRMAIKALEQEPCEDLGEMSDGYHTFNQLYYQRAVLFATIVNQNLSKAWKSFKHEDGHYCFDSNGEWFIVGIDTPQGSYTYHYAKEYWDMFHCEELHFGKHWDGHTEEDVTRLLTLEQEPKIGHWIDLNELEEGISRGCEFAGTQEVVHDTFLECINELSGVGDWDEMTTIDLNDKEIVLQDLMERFYDKIARNIYNYATTCCREG